MQVSTNERAFNFAVVYIFHMKIHYCGCYMQLIVDSHVEIHCLKLVRQSTNT